MSEQVEERGPIGEFLHQMFIHPIPWAIGGAVVGAAFIFLGPIKGWAGDVGAFAFMFAGTMIIIGGDHRGTELPTGQTQETSNV